MTVPREDTYQAEILRYIHDVHGGELVDEDQGVVQHLVKALGDRAGKHAQSISAQLTHLENRGSIAKETGWVPAKRRRLLTRIVVVEEPPEGTTVPHPIASYAHDYTLVGPPPAVGDVAAEAVAEWLLKKTTEAALFDATDVVAARHHIDCLLADQQTLTDRIAELELALAKARESVRGEKRDSDDKTAAKATAKLAELALELGQAKATADEARKYNRELEAIHTAEAKDRIYWENAAKELRRSLDKAHGETRAVERTLEEVRDRLWLVSEERKEEQEELRVLRIRYESQVETIAMALEAWPREAPEAAQGDQEARRLYEAVKTNLEGLVDAYRRYEAALWQMAERFSEVVEENHRWGDYGDEVETYIHNLEVQLITEREERKRDQEELAQLRSIASAAVQGNPAVMVNGVAEGVRSGLVGILRPSPEAKAKRAAEVKKAAADQTKRSRFSAGAGRRPSGRATPKKTPAERMAESLAEAEKRLRP